MATDLAALVANLVRCVPFEGKRVISVGAGGGQIVAWVRAAREVVGVDTDAAGIAALRARAAELGLADRLTTITDDFLRVGARADLVLFEFSLHEMPDPAAALAHAASLAPEIAVIDHAVGSPWAWHVMDEEKIVRSWRAVEARTPFAREEFAAVHAFDTRDALIAKVRPAGDRAEERARTLPGDGPFSIPFRYAIARLR